MARMNFGTKNFMQYNTNYIWGASIGVLENVCLLFGGHDKLPFLSD